MDWIFCDRVPEIPAEILDRLNRGYDLGDCGDVTEAERERSSVRRVVALNQQLRSELVRLSSDLITAQNDNESLKGHVRGLVQVTRRLGYQPGCKPPA